MENTTRHSLFSKLMSFLFISIGIFLGIFAFFADATTRTVGSSLSWNNANTYLNSDFWSASPSDYDIITALYGTGDEGSVYTENRTGYTSGSCLSGGMNVIYTGTIPASITANTVYVIASGTYELSSSISMESCSALISSGTVTLKKDNTFDSITADGINHIILDSLVLDGSGNNGGGILLSGATNISINAIVSANNLGYGIQNIYHTQYTNITNTQLYNNSVGAYFSSCDYLFLNNNQFYNNSSYGVHIGASTYVTVNNSQFYNNARGINIYNSLTTTTNTNQLYNNTYGIYIQSSTGNLFYTNAIYNNDYGLSIIGGGDNIYYGTASIYDNTTNLSGTNGFDTFLTGGTGSAFGWNDGQLILTGTTSRAMLTNPISTTGNYLIPWTGNIGNLRGYQTGYFSSLTRRYSLGSSMFSQTQPTVYLGTQLSTGSIFDATKYIGTNIMTTSGSLYIGSSSGITTFNSTVYASKTGSITTTGSSNPSLAAWNILGDVASITSGTGGSTFGTFYFSSGDGGKTLVLQLRTGNNRSTHYVYPITLDTTYPIFTGTTLGSLTSGNVMSGGYYNTGIVITFADTNISGATLNGSNYVSGTAISTSGTYIFAVTDYANNTTGMTFTIDTTVPTITGASSGGYYSGAVTITGSDAFWSGSLLNGILSTGTTRTITGEGVRIYTGYDKAGNTTGITFTIDTTVPVFTGTTLSGTHITSGGYYNTGVVITFADTNISGAILSGLNSSYLSGNFVSGGIISSTGTYLFRVYDRAGNNTGMIFTIDTSSPTVTGSYPTSGLAISGTNDIVFSRSGMDNVAIDSYTLYITGTQTASETTTGSSYTVSLINGSYTRYVAIRDRAGNTGTSQIYPFSIVAPFTGGISLTGPDTKQIGSYRYSKNLANIYMRSNEAVTYTISGNITGTPLTGNISSWLIYSPTLTGSDGRKDISVSITNGTSSGTISKNFIVRLDTVAIAPTLNTPVSGSTVAGDFLLTWSSPYPDSAGISGYEYYLSLTPTFATLVASGSTSSLVNSAAISGLYFGESNTSLYRYAKTIDKLGNFGTSAIQSFVYSGGVWDTTPSAFSFTDVTNANRNTTYLSNTLTITGITAGASILASIDRGALYVSGDFVGTTGYVQNGRTVQVELISSDEYDTTVSSTLSIGGVSDTFSITTEEEDDSTIDDYEDIETDLSTAEKLRVIAIFESLKDLYAGSKEEEFFNTFMVVLQDKIDTYDENDEEYDSLVYLYDLIERYYDGGDFDSNDDINDTRRIINGVYTAPNGKKYTITYDSSKQRFTSTNFVVPKYFPTLDSLKYIIDINNPVGSQYANAKTILARRKRAAIDGTRQSSPYTAPNKKVYYFFKDITGRYSSYTFTSEKRFDSLDKIKEYIYNNNR